MVTGDTSTAVGLGWEKGKLKVELELNIHMPSRAISSILFSLLCIELDSKFVVNIELECMCNSCFM